MKDLKKLLTFYKQCEVAKLLGYKNRSSISHWINGTKKIPLHKRGLITKELKNVASNKG